MVKIFTSKNQKIGEFGEDVSCDFLLKEGFSILERNYTKKWGEIDIVGEKDGKLYFFEVKSVSRENLDNVLHETDGYRPEDNMHPWKVKRLSRTIQTYLLERKVPENMDWQFDCLAVYLNMEKRIAKVKRIENVIL
jgi:putative endonuclease